MARRPNPIPSQQLNVALPLPVFTRLTAFLYSDLEGRVPHGAYSRFFTGQAHEYFNNKHLDLAPFIGSDPGAFVVSGSLEAINALQHFLEEKS